MALPFIEACYLPLPMLLIPAETGVEYGNQTRGMCCNHRTQEGFLVPLTMAYAEGFNDWHGKLCTEELTDEGADMIDAWLARNWETQWLKVDRSRLELSEEAWVYLKAIAEPTIHDWDGFIVDSAILIWENCD